MDGLIQHSEIPLFELYEMLVLSDPQAQPWLASHPGQGHAAREVQSLVAMPDSPRRWQLQVNVFGLTGVSSPLPTHLQEALAEQGEDSIAGLLVKLLDHHLLSGLCRQWRRRRRYHADWRATLSVLRRGCRDSVGAITMSGVPAQPGANAPADVVATVIRRCLQLPSVSVHQWRPLRLSVPEHDRARPGGPGRLGDSGKGGGVRLGRSVQVSNIGVDIHLHDLNLKCWRSIVSADDEGLLLRELCRRLLPDVCQLRLVLHPLPVDRNCHRLGGSARLGQCLWLAGAEAVSGTSLRIDTDLQGRCGPAEPINC